MPAGRRRRWWIAGAAVMLSAAVVVTALLTVEWAAHLPYLLAPPAVFVLVGGRRWAAWIPAVLGLFVALAYELTPSQPAYSGWIILAVGA